MSVRKWMFAGALLLAAGLSSLGFAQKPGLKFNPDKKFKIVQFTDLHVKWQDPRSDIAFERMNQVLDDEKPDLVIFTGDIIYSKPALENMRNVLKTVSDRKIPFSIVFGNHDNEQGATKEELLKVAESLPYSLTADEVPEISGVGNYALTVRSSDGKKDACVLYCIDSNTYSTIKGVKDTIILSVTRSIGIVRKAQSLPGITGESRFLLWLSSISHCRSLIKRLPMRMPNSMAYVGKRHALRP